MAESWNVRPLGQSDWPQVEKLFGERGACGGCWCMHWRLPRGGKLWEEMKGERNRTAFHELVENGSARGALAFDGEQPVGWCSFGPREDFPRLNKSRWIHKEWQPGTWAVVCFYITAKYRRRGVATALLEKQFVSPETMVHKRLKPTRLQTSGEKIPVKSQPHLPTPAQPHCSARQDLRRSHRRIIPARYSA